MKNVLYGIAFGHWNAGLFFMFELGPRSWIPYAQYAVAGLFVIAARIGNVAPPQEADR